MAEHIATAHPTIKMDGGHIGWHWSCSCGRSTTGLHATEEKALHAAKAHAPGPAPEVLGHVVVEIIPCDRISHGEVDKPMCRYFNTAGRYPCKNCQGDGTRWAGPAIPVELYPYTTGVWLGPEWVSTPDESAEGRTTSQAPQPEG